MDRAGIFMDGAYLMHVIRDLIGDQRVDYQALANAILQAAPSPLGKQILRIYYYDCLPYQTSPPTPDQTWRFAQKQKFFHALQRTPNFEVREGRLEFRGTDARGKQIFQQKRVDLQLGLDLALLATKHLIEHAFIVSGDSDLIPAVSMAKAEGVVVHLVYGPGCHDDLLNEADNRIEITPAFLSQCHLLI